VIRRNRNADFAAILATINAAAQAYRPVLAPGLWHEPYMPKEELESEIAHGVEFWVEEASRRLSGVMGIQDRGDVTLIRHAYVTPSLQRSGVGTRLLHHLQGLTTKPILIGTWAAASWAIGFYRKNGFRVLASAEKDRLLRRYWSIPESQADASVVLADQRWTDTSSPSLTT
jgi:N-acetylglutamate synthase-like GNAT family acetyltransferase